MQSREVAGGVVQTSVSATYTPTGQVATTTDARGNVARYAYDLLDRLAAVTDPTSRTAQFTYTVLGQPYRTYNKAIQSGPLIERTWTADGLIASLKDANGNITTFAYDRFDRLVTMTYPGGSTEPATYDANDNVLTTVTRAGATLRYGYDTLNRLVTKTAAASAVACNATPSSTPTVTYSYDLVGRVKGVCDNSSAIAALTAPGSALTYTTSYSYNRLDQPTGITFDPVPTPTLPSAGSVSTFTFGYNAADQRTSSAVSDNSWIDYPAGPTATTSYTANSLNQYTAVGSVTPTYDANGNLTSDGIYTFGFDPENRLTSASKTGFAASYAFDGLGQRKTKIVNGTTTAFVTDPYGREILEYDGSGSILRWYAYGLGPNDVLAQTDVGTSKRLTPLQDLLGSVIALMDSSAGSLLRFGYKPYGDSSNAPDQFAYTGQRIDDELGGLYYYRARHYSPSWGRFLQTDPVGYAAGLLLYAYTGNDPLNFIDPFGLEASSSGGWGIWDTIHAGLTAASFCPSICGSAFSLVGAGIHAAQGNWTQAAISTGAAVAGVVSDAGAIKLAALAAVAAKDSLALAKSGAVASRALTVEKAGADLAQQIGKNRVSAMTPSGRMSIDLAGKSHYEKSVAGYVPTPHVKFQKLNTSPTGRTSLSKRDVVTRPATMDDIRTARKIVERRGQ